MLDPQRKKAVNDAGLIDCIEPATNHALGQIAVDDTEAVRVAVAKARAAQAAWAKSTFAERRRLLQAMLDYVLEHADTIVDYAARDAGKTRESGMVGEIWTVCAKLQWTIKNGEKHLKPERVSSGIFPHKKAMIEYYPKGVVGVITPWNYPFQNIMGPVIAALFAGNACVVKVSEAVAWSSQKYQEMFHEILDELGLPRALLRIVQGYGETGAALVRSGVDLVIFTGSVPNGRRIIEGSVEHITPVILELGGKDPMIICDDADLEEAVHSAMGGVFIACGQNCLAAERVLVHDGIYDRFVDRVRSEVERFRQGPPEGCGEIDVSAMVSPAQVDVVEALVDDAVAKGATLLVGGKRVLAEQGNYFAPTILTDVTDEMRITQEETFGPVLCIRRVADDSEAVRIANSVEFGLCSSVFSTDRSRAERIAKQLDAGATCVNGFGITYMAQDLPFGGVKASGFGRLNGRDGLRACCNQKSVLYDRLPLHPAPRMFPVRSHDYDISKATIELLYRRGIGNKFKALVRLLKASRDNQETIES